MSAILPAGRTVWGLQLPVQSQSTAYAQPWEAGAGPEEIAEVARAADRAGAFSVAVCDHVAIPEPLVPTMGATWYDTVATLGWLAGITTRVHLLSHVAVLAYRHPLVTAKAWCTLDAISGGRAILGAGAGHVEAEFALLGADFARRGNLLDDALVAVRAAFTEEVVDGAAVAPRPSRPGGPPIWVGGSSGAARRRAARLGDGWLPQGPPKIGMRAAIEQIRRERGDRGPIDIGGFAPPVYAGHPTFDAGPHALTGEPGRIAETLRKVAGAGVGHLLVRFPSRTSGEMAEQVERFGAEVWPEVQPA